MFRGIIFGIVLSSVALGSADAATIYVPDDYSTIQEALIACVNGDEIIVRPGVYYEVVDFEGKAVTLRSEKGPEVTIVDGEQRNWGVMMFRNFEGPDSVLEGFTITNGGGHLGNDGAIYCFQSSPTITRNLITQNLCCGLFFMESSPTVMENQITHNLATQSGGGIVCVRSTAMIADNLIAGNEAISGGGGAVYCYEDASTIHSNIILDNLAKGGGAFYLDDPIHPFGSDPSANDYPIVIGNIIARNTALNDGGAVYCHEEEFVMNCNTIVGNTAGLKGGGLIANESAYPVLSNCIFWNNDAQDGKEIYITDNGIPSKVTISYSVVEGGLNGVFVEPDAELLWGDHMIDTDPLFVDANSNDFHLTLQSPCINYGDDTLYHLPLKDVEKDPRVAGAGIDIGADEFFPHLYCIGNVVSGATIQFKVIGDQGVEPVWLALGSGVRDNPISTPYGDLHLEWPPLNIRNLGTVPSSGVIVVPKMVQYCCPTGEQYPFQALVGPLAPGSVLTNLLTLTVE